MMTDRELVHAALAGDGRAIAQLDARWRPEITAFARLRLHDQDAADDIAQATLVRVFANLPHFRQDARFGTWVFTIARNLIINETRSRYRARRDHEAEPERLVDERAATDGPLLRRELRGQIGGALAKLRPAHREALLLVDGDGRSYEETAALTGANLGTIKSRVCRARRAFAAHYQR